MIVDKIKKRENNYPIKRKNKVDIPKDKWVKCDKCKEIIYKDVLKDNGQFYLVHRMERQ